MIWLIISIILFVIANIAIIFLSAEMKVSKWNLFSLLALLLMIPGFISIVPANNVGVKYSSLHGTSETTLAEGWHLKTPLDKVYKISTEVQSVTVTNLTTQTKDAQYVNSTLDIKYRVNAENAYVVFKQYRSIDRVGSTLIVPTTQRVLELITTKYNVMDILGEKRADIYSAITSELQKEFSQYGIEFYSISITDMDAGQAIEDAITAEAVAKKAVETAEQELLKAQTDAKQQAVQAQAKQDAAKIDAETRIIEAEAERKSNELKSASLTDEILKQEWIEKWDGKMPIYYGGDGNLLISPDVTE